MNDFLDNMGNLKEFVKSYRESDEYKKINEMTTDNIIAHTQEKLSDHIANIIKLNNDDPSPLNKSRLIIAQTVFNFTEALGDPKKIIEKSYEIVNYLSTNGYTITAEIVISETTKYLAVLEMHKNQPIGMFEYFSFMMQLVHCVIKGMIEDNKSKK